MTEHDFWIALEFRVSGEFAGMLANNLRFRWCDGFIPQQYQLDDATPRITDRAWMVNDQDQEVWDFTLFLDRTSASRSEIDWPTLIPPNDVTRWIAIDVPGKLIQIEPSAAVPDLVPPKQGRTPRLSDDLQK